MKKHLILLFIALMVCCGNAEADVKGLQYIGVETGMRNPYSSNELADAQKLPVLQLTVRGNMMGYELNSLTFRASGTINEPEDLLAVYLYNDGNGNGNIDDDEQQIGNAAFFTEDNGTITFYGLPAIWPYTTSFKINLLLVVDMSGKAEEGETVVFLIFDGESMGLVKTADNAFPSITTEFPIESYFKKISYTEGSLTAYPDSNYRNYGHVDYEESDVKLLHFSIKASSHSPVQLQSIKITSNGSADEVNDIDAITIAYDLNTNGKFDEEDYYVNSSGTFEEQNGSILVTGLNEIIQPNTAMGFFVYYDLSFGESSYNERVNAEFVPSTDIVAKDFVTGKDIPVYGPDWLL